MIERIRTVGFKGFDLDEDVPQKVIYSGRNKSGKSTRAGAIAIALYGHIPFSTAGKLPGDILNSFGKDELVVSVTIGGTEFARKFSRNSKGGVSQSVQIDKKKSSKENFAILMNQAGAPRIADVAEFMKQSDAKKTDTLFGLFPNDALATIDIDIENAKAEISQIEKKKDGAVATIQRLTNSKQYLGIPSGNIAETRNEINKVESQIVELDEQILQAEIEEATEKGRQEEKERIENETAEKKVDPIDAEISIGERQIADYKANNGSEQPGAFDGVMQEMGYDNEDTNQNIPHKIEGSAFLGSMGGKLASKSIQRIIDALKGAGCGTCAALIVAKQELKKFKEVS